MIGLFTSNAASAAAKLFALRVRDGDNAIASGCLGGKLCRETPLRVGRKGRVPKSARDKILPDPFSARSAASDEVAFVDEFARLGIFINKWAGSDRSAQQGSRLLEEGGIRCLIASQG
jgi:hypothetical protein